MTTTEEAGMADADLDGEIALRSVRALRSCVLADERSGRIGADYRKLLTQLRGDIDRVLAAGSHPLCGRSDGPLGEADVGWHTVCPGGDR
jgi:hypothetical protein